MLNNIDISAKRQKLIIYVILTIITLAVFWQVNHYDFINFDDNVYVTGNSHIQSGITLDGFRWAFSTRYLDLWNPLVWLSFMFDYQLHGLNAGGYHLTNLMLHILSTLLLFWLFNRMTKAIWKSAFVATLFALHPLHVESVAWIAERKDVLSAFFWMLTLCLYVYYTEKPFIRRYLLVLFSFVCAFMSKPMVVTLPMVMILLDYWPLGRLQSRKIATDFKVIMPDSTNQSTQEIKLEKEILKKNISTPNAWKLPETKIAGIIPLWQLWEKIPFFVLSALIVTITLYTPNTPNEQATSLKVFPLGSRLANAPVSFVAYLEKTFWPNDLAIFYPFSDQLPAWQVLGTTLLIIVISAAVIIMAKRLPYLFVGWLWYAITILPVIGIIQISLSTPYSMADRYTYLPLIGISMMLAWGIPLLLQREDMRIKILFPAGIIFLVIMAVLTWQQCGYWKNDITLFNHALQVTKNNYITRNNMGTAYFKLGQYQRAIEDYNKAITLKTDFADAYDNRGTAYDRLGQFQRAIEDYNKAITLKTDFAYAYYNRGTAYDRLGQYQRAIEDYNKAITLKPDFAYAYYDRGTAYDKLGQHQRAVDDFSQTIGMKKDYADAYNNRATIYLNQGNKEQGCRDAQKACALGNCKTLEVAQGKGLCR